MTAEEIALKNFNERTTWEAAWEIALQLALINEKLATLIDIQKFQSPGYDEADAAADNRLLSDLFQQPVNPGDRQRQTESPERPPEANK